MDDCSAFCLDRGTIKKKKLTTFPFPRSSRRQGWNPFISAWLSSFIFPYLWSYISDSTIVSCYGTYTCTQRKETGSVRLLVKNCIRMYAAHPEKHYARWEERYHLWNICSPSNEASKAACYLDCISFVMFWLWYGPESLQQTRRATATAHWLSSASEQSNSFSGCLNNQMKTDNVQEPPAKIVSQIDPLKCLGCITMSNRASYYGFSWFL